jgi:hypothetical protein
MTLARFMDFANLTDLDFFTGINNLLAETACSLDLYTANTMPKPGVSTGAPNRDGPVG